MHCLCHCFFSSLGEASYVAFLSLHSCAFLHPPWLVWLIESLPFEGRKKSLPLKHNSSPLDQCWNSASLLYIIVKWKQTGARVQMLELTFSFLIITFSVAWLICASLNQPAEYIITLVPLTENRTLCRTCCWCTLSFIIRIDKKHPYMSSPWSGSEMWTAPPQSSNIWTASSDSSNAGCEPGESWHRQTLGRWNNAWIWAQRNAAAEWLDSNDVSKRVQVVTEDTMLCEIHAACLPWTSLSFRNHRMLAAGLLPDVVHVRVIRSPSMAGLVNPVISGRPGTPVAHGSIIINNILNTCIRWAE